MKLSVSVPEELWTRAREQGGGLNASRLVQAALETYAARALTAGYSLARPEAADELFAAAKQRLATEAQEEFDRGYVAGAATAGKLDWVDIERYRDCGFDMTRWIKVYRDSAWDWQDGRHPENASPLSAVNPLCEVMGPLIMPWEYEQDPVPSDTFLRGFGQALRDLWKEVYEGEDSSSSAEEGEEGASE